jgi:hypothetical protein
MQAHPQRLAAKLTTNSRALSVPIPTHRLEFFLSHKRLVQAILAIDFED